MNNDETQSSEKINDTILGTKTASMKSECENTTPKWERECPTCNKELVYSSIHELRRAIRNNTVCPKCRGLKHSIPTPVAGWTKPCPTCGKELIYKGRQDWRRSIKENATCVACRGLKRRTTTPLGGWKKSCPKCGKEMVYPTKGTLNNSIRKNCVCSKCVPRKKKLPVPDGGWKRNCPTCGKELHYKKKWAFQQAEKRNGKCFSCMNLKVPVLEKYTKLCPRCNREMTYLSREVFLHSVAQNRCCNNCKNKGRHPSEITRKKMGAAHVGLKHTEQHRENIRGQGNPMYGVHRYDELNPFYGKRHSEEARRKMRVAMCKKVLRMYWSHGRMASIGAGEKAYFDQLERERGWFGNRQHFVSHLGYFVDYYEPNHNIVVEYDEPRHYRHGHLREKDRVRMEQIRSYLNCEFWRYDAYRKQLVKVWTIQNRK